MGFINEGGSPVLQYNWVYTAPTLSTNTLISGAAHKLAFMGQVRHATKKTGTIAIRKIHFRCGAITNATATTRVSLQDISLTAGPPTQPDGTQDQYYDFTAGSLSANAMNVTGNLSADRTVDLSANSIGDTNSRWLAVVFEFASGFGSDSIVIHGVVNTAVTLSLGGTTVLDTTGSYAVVTQRSGIVILECDDGTFAFLNPCPPYSGLGNVSVASNAAVRRAGLKFKVPTTRKIEGAAVFVTTPNNADGRFVLYDTDGTTELASVNLDNDAIVATSTLQFAEFLFPPVILKANAYYRLVYVPSTTTGQGVQYFDVANVAHLEGSLLGQNAHWTQHNGTAWSDTTTRVPLFGVCFSAFQDGAKIIGG